ncbi:hypothetical protein EV656_1048 [Rhodovulum adriaticum]|uniref:Tetratricopeptide repeat protein n=2 Tax=Rhodovulum adriaticum TaxID=35804 RepID=A0A4R2NN26_RHOAD|nr:hypothetical protein [Rhodovulum adriaticum]TCP23040.1 hypothetical protein EV656_1048 [Rhodovulum adriaticum]
MRAGLALWLALGTGVAQAQSPLSAIDWLSDSVTAPDLGRTAPGMAPVQPLSPITVTPLGAASADAVGLLPAGVAGLPRNLWGAGDSAAIAAAIRAEQVDTLPAAQALLTTVLLAELDPPTGETREGEILMARIDKLLDIGALDQAQALVERAGPTHPALFRRWFDIALLTGQEDRACAAMRATPGIAPTFPARIFCLARGGDWNAAALTLETARVLGYVTEDEDALLSRFLDPALAEDSAPLPAPARPSPLIYRMREAIGEPLPSAMLPLAFARADLRRTAGWKARIAAAERLARRGVLGPNQLLGIWTERKPAASGGLWDRVEALQAVDVALLSGKPRAVARALPRAWSEMERAGLEVPFAELYGARLARMKLDGAAAALAFRIGLLSSDYRAVARAHDPANAEEAFLAGLALGQVADLPPRDALATALKDGFAARDLPPAQARLIREHRRGEALLAALDLITGGARGDLGDVTAALAIFRHMGLEDTARQTALQLMLLERRG